jgi:hypothetical protein
LSLFYIKSQVLNIVFWVDSGVNDYKSVLLFFLRLVI